jgi:D-glycero-D-manno-heptose 1,7-bisphosphate phosphatase
MGARRAVFLDRDGVINRNVFNPASGEYEAPLTAADFTLAPGALEALRRLQRAGFLLFVVSNQPNYAKRKASLEELAAIDATMRRELAAAGVAFAGVYYCLHHPEGVVPEYSGPCACRKPSPYFLLRAMRDFGVEAAHSWMIGDRDTDVLCGRAAGVRTIFIDELGGGGGRNEADWTGPDLAAAAEHICGILRTAGDQRLGFGAQGPCSSAASVSRSSRTRRRPDSRSFASYHSWVV